MTRGAPVALDFEINVTALLVIGSILWFGYLISIFGIGWPRGNCFHCGSNCAIKLW